MSEHFQGQVVKIFTREGTTPAGKKWRSYSFKLLDVVSGIEFRPFFRLKNDPKFKEGDFIQFDADATDNENAMTVVVNTGQPWTPPVQEAKVPEPVKEAAQAAPAKEKASTKPAASAATTSYQTEKVAREQYWADKEQRDIEHTQPRISYQSARKDALAFAALLSENKALPISEAAGKAGTAKRYEQMLDIVNKLTVQFHKDTETLRVLANVADAGVISVPKPGDLPEDASETEAEVSMRIPKYKTETTSGDNWS